MGKKVLKNKTKSLLKLAAISIFAICTFGSTKVYAYIDENVCVNSAKSQLGDFYVSTFEASFRERCKQGVSGGEYAYGMEAPTSTNFPESTGSNTFSFEARRIVYTEGVKDNIWGSITCDTSLASFDKSRLDCQTNKNKWHQGETFNVTVQSSLLSGSSDDAIVSANVPYTSCYKGYSNKCKSNHLYFKVFEITNVTHSDSPKATYNGVDYSSTSTSESNPIKVGKGGKLVFTHQLRRNDKWDKPSSPELKEVYLRKIKNGSTTVKEDSSWKKLTLKTRTSTSLDYGPWADVEDSIDVIDLGIEPGQVKKVCSVLTHRKVKSLTNSRTAYDDGTSNDKTDKSEICVYVKLDALVARSRSTVQMDDGVTKATAKSEDNPNYQTVSIYGGSKKENYEIDFSHKIVVQGDSAKSATFNYSVYTGSSVSGSTGSPITTGSPVIAGGGTGKITYSDGTNLHRVTFKLNEGASKTVCEKVSYNPLIIYLNAAGTGGDPDGSGESAVCGTVTRRSPDVIHLTAETNTYHCTDPSNINPSKIYFDTESPQCVTFQHKFTSVDGQVLTSNYKIYYSEDGGATVKSTSTGTVTTDKTSGSTKYKNVVKEHKVDLDYGQLKTVCEKVEFTPNTFKLHRTASGDPDGITPDGGTGYTDWRCIKVGRPTKTTIDDGIFEITGLSEGKLDNEAETGGPYGPGGAWLMKQEQATITYSHRLKRDNNTHEHDSSKPAEDVTVKYRFGKGDDSFSNNDILNTTGIGSTIIKNNQTVGPFNSINGSSLFGANTTARAEVVGTPTSYCQSIFFHSKQYLMHGEYWMVDGNIWDEKPGMISSSDPTPYPESTEGSVGKSAPGCVNVVRPWNYKIKKIEPKTQNIIQSLGDEYTTKFKIKIGKNDNSYLLTDVDKAEIQFVSFRITSTSGSLPGNLNYSGNGPCAYYNSQGMVNNTCGVLKQETNQKFGKNSPANGTTYYNNGVVCSGSDCSYTAEISIKNTLTEEMNLQLNEKYCIAVGIKSANSGDGFNFSNTWAVSPPSCVNIGKYPNLQVWGGSVFSSGGISTSVTKYQNKYYGSWGDFALIANGSISKTASGASLISGSATSDTCTLSSITITNDNCNGHITSRSNLGEAKINAFSVAEFKRKLKDRYLDDPNNYRVLSTIDSSSLTSGKNPFIVYNPNGDIFIASNIGFGGGTYDKHNVPQAIIYAKGNIYISEQVTHIVAWIIADGTVNTCADASGHTPELTQDSCGLKLTVDGPIIASKTYFNRTYGANGHEGTSAVPAEVINLNSSVYLFSNYQAKGDQPSTTHIQKMPARF